MLQHLTLAQAAARNSDGATESVERSAEIKVPNFVLAIEEPELYQHPSRQRHFSAILFKLASGAIPGVSGKTQILYATHSPLFVGIDRIDQIRVLTKKENGNAFRKSQSSSTRNLMTLRTKCGSPTGLMEQYLMARLCDQG